MSGEIVLLDLLCTDSDRLIDNGVYGEVECSCKKLA